MAIRAPSCANRKASPRPMPLLPPVTSATRLRSDIRLPGKISWKNFQYSLAAAEVLLKPRDDYRHVISLFGSPGPLFGRGHQRLGDHERRGALHVDRGFLQAANSKLFPIDVLRLDQAVTISDEQRVGNYCQRSFLIDVIFHDAKNHTTFIQLLRSAVADQNCGQGARVRITQRSGAVLADWEEKTRDPVAAGAAYRRSV